MGKAVVGFLAGVLLMGVVSWTAMPGLMLKERLSPYTVEETVAKITERALGKNWVVAGVKPLHKSVAKHGGGDLDPVILVNLCHAKHAYNILKDDENKKLSVFMPCTVTVYKKSDGRVYIGSMNAGLLGRMFGGVVARVMSVVAEDQKSFISL